MTMTPEEEDRFFADPAPCGECDGRHTVGRHRWRLALGLDPFSGVLASRQRQLDADARDAAQRRQDEAR